MSTPIDDGGPAFPVPLTFSPHNGTPCHTGQYWDGNGMTLRDWLASKASEEDILLNVPGTCGELAKLLKIPLHELNHSHTLLVRCEARYAYADAMIAARKGTK